ncbi:PhoH family protein, partial [Virgibacillus profundi]|uniref:PhoH family protein n=1 Tax=Virgibacillus profundi TaxID=2024555 RepID=UPI0013FD7752
DHAGTGKTFLAMYMALEQVLDKETPYEQLLIVRSIVPTKEIGFLPGDIEEKIAVYVAPYRSCASEMFYDKGAYDKLKHNGYVDFKPTSFIRGETYHNTIILVDEMQNLNFHELDSIITRVGQDSKIIFCGDF